MNTDELEVKHFGPSDTAVVSVYVNNRMVFERIYTKAGLLRECGDCCWPIELNIVQFKTKTDS